MFRFLCGLCMGLIFLLTPGVAAAGDKTILCQEVQSDIVDTASQAGEFSILIAAVEAAGLEGALRGKGPFTIFAPTDAAFAALPEGLIEHLMKPENKYKLVSILTYHMLAEDLKFSDLAGNMLEAETLNGAKTTVHAIDDLKVGGASIIKPDIKTSNGVIHAIDVVMVPPNDWRVRRPTR